MKEFCYPPPSPRSFQERFDLKPQYLTADTAYGAAETLNWIVNYSSPRALRADVPEQLL